MARTFGWWTLILMIPLCTGCAAPEQARPFNPPSANKLGVHLLLDDGKDRWPPEVWREHMEIASSMTGEWGYVTQVVKLDTLDVALWQAFMDDCRDLHLTPILRLATTYDHSKNYWTAPPADADGGYSRAAERFARFVSELEWPTEDHYVIIGNEPNHGNEWGGTPDPAAYAWYLIDVAEAIHAADPSARVLNAGFDPYTPHTNGQPAPDGFAYMDEEIFLDQMVAAQPDVFTHIDAWSSHPYPTGPFRDPPWEQTFQIDLLNGAANPAHNDPPPGIANRGVNGYEWELWKLSTYGLAPLPVFISETGWRHQETSRSGLGDRGGGYPDASTVSLYFDLALRGNKGRYPDMPETGWTPWLDDPRVAAITPFAFNGRPDQWGHSNWLILNADGRVLGQYPMVEMMEGMSDTGH